MINHIIFNKKEDFIIHAGEYEFNITTAPKLNSRFPAYFMTNDPEKVWPGAIVHYVMDTSLGKFWMIPRSCPASHTCTCNIHTN